jgi:hypothetical protein
MLKHESDRPARRWLPALAAVALLAAALVPLMTTGQVRAQGGETQTKAWKDISLIYTTDVKGKIEPCG